MGLVASGNSSTRRPLGSVYSLMPSMLGPAATPEQIGREIKRLEGEMQRHARNLEFEQAARVRDQLVRLKDRAFGAHGSDNAPLAG